MLQQSTSTELFPSRPSSHAGEAVFARDRVTFLKGRDAILDARPALAELAARSGLEGEADNLEFFLKTPYALKKTPYLALVRGGSRGLGSGSTALTGAVLLFEYRTVFGFGSRVFSTADYSGRRDVIAPAASRAATAALVAHDLLERGAHIVHLAFSDVHQSQHYPASAGQWEVPEGSAEQAIAEEFGAGSSHVSGKWALFERQIPVYLRLLSTFDATLAIIGQRTRSNLRYYRRRAELDLGSRFVDQPRLTLQEFLAFNRQATYAVTDKLATHRYNTLATIPNCHVRGVQAGDGRWLSLVGIRYHGSAVEIDWQMNRNDLKSHSLGTVMRAYLIDREIARGSTRLYIEGGTPQPIQRSFINQRVCELTVIRNSLYLRFLKRFGPWLFPPKNYIGKVLRDPQLHWRSW